MLPPGSNLDRWSLLSSPFNFVAEMCLFSKRNSRHVPFEFFFLQLGLPISSCIWFNGYSSTTGSVCLTIWLASGSVNYVRLSKHARNCQWAKLGGLHFSNVFFSSPATYWGYEKFLEWRYVQNTQSECSTVMGRCSHTSPIAAVPVSLFGLDVPTSRGMSRRHQEKHLYDIIFDIVRDQKAPRNKSLTVMQSRRQEPEDWRTVGVRKTCIRIYYTHRVQYVLMNHKYIIYEKYSGTTAVSCGSCPYSRMLLLTVEILPRGSFSESIASKRVMRVAWSIY